MKPLPLVVSAVLVSGPGYLAAQQTVTLTGQVRPRFEYRDPAPTTADAFTSMRVRLQVAAVMEGNVKAVIQFQDVRIWGSERNTLSDFSADNLDLHQGYLEVAGSSGTTQYSARAGRQEVSFGGERLVGPVAWTQQGRSFDGVRLTASRNAVHIDALAAALGDRSSGITNDALLLAGYSQVGGVGPGTLDLYAVFNRIEVIPATNQTTVGARWWGERGALSFRGESSFQFGERAGDDVSAFMVGGRVGTALGGGRASITLWYDYLSGDDDPTDTDQRVFDTLFATNHKFYGLADLFLNIPAHTAGRGLQDVAVKGSLRVEPNVRLGLDLHAFRAAQSSGLSTARFGEEADLTAHYTHNAALGFTAGLSYVVAGDGLTQIGRLSDNMAWVFVMADARF